MKCTMKVKNRNTLNYLTVCYKICIYFKPKKYICTHETMLYIT